MTPHARRRHWIAYDTDLRGSLFREVHGFEPNDAEQWAMRVASTKEYDLFEAAYSRQPLSLERRQ